MEKRYSLKRERIREYLKNTTEHPSAEQIYFALKEEFSDLSLGTVYRNLKEMKKNGELISVGVVCDKERFDAQTFFHTHAVCVSCGKVEDVFGLEISEEFIKTAESLTGFSVNGTNLLFTGLCEKCKKGALKNEKRNV